jgi:hypothetical protein
MFLTIGKPAEYDQYGHPKRAQCQPYLHNWRLRLFDRGAEEVIFEGTYYLCREIQAACSGMTDLDAIRARAEELLAEHEQDLEETAAVDVPAPGDEEATTPYPAGPSTDESTVAIPREEMEERARRRRKDFEL